MNNRAEWKEKLPSMQLPSIDLKRRLNWELQTCNPRQVVIHHMKWQETNQTFGFILLMLVIWASYRFTSALKVTVQLVTSRRIKLWAGKHKWALLVKTKMLFYFNKEISLLLLKMIILKEKMCEYKFQWCIIHHMNKINAWIKLTSEFPRILMRFSFIAMWAETKHLRLWNRSQ